MMDSLDYIQVLIVEDSVADAYVLTRILREFSHKHYQLHLTTVSTLKEMLAALAGDVYFDMLVLDASLPDGSLIDRFQDIKRIAKGKPRIIVYTGYADPELKDAFLVNGADCVVLKSGEVSEVRKRLRLQLLDTIASHIAASVDVLENELLKTSMPDE